MDLAFNLVEFNVSDPDVAERWLQYVAKVKLFFKLKNITDGTTQLMYLLLLAGQGIVNLHARYKKVDEHGAQDESETFQEFADKLSTHFNPKSNRILNVYNFRLMRQMEGEPFNDFYDRLLEKVQFCNFPDKDFELQVQILYGCASPKLREAALSMPDITLAQLVSKGSVVDSVKHTMEEMSGEHKGVFGLKAKPPGYVSKRQALESLNQNRETFRPAKSCFNCGGVYPHESGSCPALGKNCNNCGKKNHYARVCNSSKSRQQGRVNAVVETEDINELVVWTVSAKQCPVFNAERTSKIPHTWLLIGSSLFKFFVDTGAECNIMDLHTFNGVYPKPAVSKSRTILRPYGASKHIETCGEFVTEVATKDNKKALTRFVIAPGKFGNLLSYSTAVELGIISRVNTIGEGATADLFKEQMEKKFPRLFENRIGKISGVKIKLSIDPKVKPVYQALRNQPYHLIKPIQSCLDKMEANDLIQRQNGPTPWLSNIHPVPKPGSVDEVRITIDMRAANTAILRERHPLRRLEDLIVLVNGAKLMSKVDLNCAYNQFELAEESKYITGFITPNGAYVWNRLSLGISSAAELFQKALEELLIGLTGQLNLCDDIFVWGVIGASDHDANLEAVLRRLEQRGATVNGPKCKLKQSELDFFGMHFSDQGIAISDEKRETLLHAKEPQNPSEILSFLGLAAFLEPFIPNLATIAEPMRRLTRNKTVWSWQEEQQKAFEFLKLSLIKHPLAYFDLNKRTKVVVDASPVGVGGVISQYPHGKPEDEVLVKNCSRSLTQIEQRYSQPEREAVGAVWVCEKNKLILVGCEFDLYIDNTAIQSIFSNPFSNPSARIRRLALRMLPFKCRVFHTDGKGNIADYLSRNPVESNCCEHERIAEEYIFMLTTACIPSAMSREEIITATAADPDIQDAIDSIRSGKPDRSSPFHQVMPELMVSSDGLVLRDTRVVLPQSLIQRAVDLAHSGHQGVVKTKELLKRHVWFPRLADIVERTVRNCLHCQVNQPQNHPEPARLMPTPEGPWLEVDVDFYGPVKSKYKFVLVDRFSRFLLLRSLSNVKGPTVIAALENICSEFGFMAVLKSDNGPPFNGFEFSNWCERAGIKHRKITPYHPPANGLAERMMIPLGKIYRVPGKHSLDYAKEERDFVSAYNATPHSSTGTPPRVLLFRSTASSTRLPTFQFKQPDDPTLVMARKQELEARARALEFKDSKLHTSAHTFEIGDVVLQKQTRTSKTVPNFDPEPYTITAIKGPSVTICREGRCFLRNAVLLKKVTRHSFQVEKPKYTPPAKRSLGFTSLSLALASRSMDSDSGQGTLLESQQDPLQEPQREPQQEPQQESQQEPQLESQQDPSRIPQQPSAAPTHTRHSAHDSAPPAAALLDPDERPINPARTVQAAGGSTGHGTTKCDRCGGSYKSGVGIATHKRSCKGTPQYS